MYLLADTPENRRLIGHYVEVFQYPDGRIEIRVGVKLWMPVTASAEEVCFASMAYGKAIEPFFVNYQLGISSRREDDGLRGPPALYEEMEAITVRHPPSVQRACENVIARFSSGARTVTL